VVFNRFERFTSFKPPAMPVVGDFEISGLADNFLMKIKENVNPGMEKWEFSKIAFENRKNMQSQIVVCHSRDLSPDVNWLVRNAIRHIVVP
jgi:hypothetical protein